MSGQTRCLPLFAFVLTVLGGCAGLVPTPSRERVVLKTSSSTRYYPIRGTTTTAIFNEIDRNGLVDSKARRAVGLTSAEWDMAWKGRETRPGRCGGESMTITVKLVVTLPQHKRSSDLTPDLSANWRRFVASVAAHEQRHVDIYLNGAKQMKTRLEAILASSVPGSCAELEQTIRRTWVGQQADIEGAQDRFHLEDEAKSHDDRKPLQAQIAVNQARLSAINAEMTSLDQMLAALQRRHDTTRAELGAVTAEMGKSGASPPGCSHSGLARRIEALCRRYGELVAAFNALVEQHRGVVARRNKLADEHNRVVATTNDLVEALNWTR